MRRSYVLDPGSSVTLVRMGNSSRALTWLTAGVFAALLLPRLAQDGMFMDGELYAAVAHNEARGYGTFWLPRFSERGVAGLPAFHEHPPLFFGLLATWFRIFGSGFWVERAFSLFTALLLAGLLVLLWRQLIPGDRGRRASWWPILLWIIVPTVFRSYHNNMIENTMGLFTTAAVLCVLKSGDRWWPWWPLAGLCVVLASLTKGLPGLFPLAAPVLCWIALRNGSLARAFAASSLMTALVVVAYALLWAWPDAHANLSVYVEKRLLHRIAAMPTVEHHWASLEMLFSNMLGPLAIVVVLWASLRKHTGSMGPDRRAALAMLLTGLSGVAPLMLTLVQKSFYMTAALPLISLALALWSLPYMERLLAMLAPRAVAIRAITGAGMVAVAGAIIAAVALFGTAGRDAELLRDVRRIGPVVGPDRTVGLPPALWNEWGLQTYLMRYASISLDNGPVPHTWYVTTKNGPIPDTLDHHAVDLGLETLQLYRRAQDP